MKKFFRSDIQALRGIAVAAVILYHAEIYLYGNQLFSGGYLGVDIFFVISGFLITKILIKNIDKSTYSFFLFMNFRIRRILPLLLFVISIFGIISSLYLLPSVLFDFSKAQLSSIFFFSNYFFFASALNYYDFSALLKPLTHTWSLSLEIQMYIFLFLMFTIILRFSKKKITIVLIVILFLSFLISLITNLYNSQLSFYSFHSRIWEFLVGSLAFTVLDKLKSIPCKRYLSFSGFILIIFSLFLFNKNTNHPSYLTIIPVFGIFLIITFYQRLTFMNFFLQNKLLIFLGQISYSLYLWHYPIFAFCRNLNLLNNNYLLKIFIIALLLVLSFLSFRFIEQPFRNQIKINNKTCYLILFFLFLINFIVGYFIYTQYNLKKNILLFNNKFIVENYNLDNQFLIDERNNALTNLKKKTNQIIKHDKKKLLILGDSMSLDIFNILINNKYTSANFQISHYYFLNECLEKGNRSGDYNCLDINKDDHSAVNSNIINEADIILLNYLYNAPWNKNYIENIDLFIKRNQNKNKKFIIVSDRYRFLFNLNYSILDEFIFQKRSLPNKKELKNIENLYFLYRSKDTDIINTKLKSISNQKNILFLDFSSWQCDLKRKTCKVINEMGNKIYLDSVSHMHLNSNISFNENLISFFKK
jgi:peptidoglycan/LPS O-acetylase OafA/YrhL